MFFEKPVGFAVASLFATLFLLSPLQASADSEDGGFDGQGRIGLQFGAVPRQSSLMVGLFGGGGVRYGAFRAGVDATLALGGSREGSGFAVLTGAFGTLGIRGPVSAFTPIADLHFGKAWVHTEGGPNIDSSGWFGGATAGIASFDRASHICVFLTVTGIVPVSPPSGMNCRSATCVVVPVLFRFGVGYL